MKKYTVVILLVILFSASFVAINPFVEATSEQPDYSWMQKVDKDLLKMMSNGDGEILADVNNDGVVDIIDLSIVSMAYGAFEGEPNYNSDADLNQDGIVDARDLSVVTIDYGTSQLLSTIVVAEQDLEGVKNLIVSNGGTVSRTLESIDAVSAEIPKNNIQIIAESNLAKKIWLNHRIELNPRYDQMNAKAEFLERLLESSTKQASSEEFKREEFKLDMSRFDPERYAFPDGGIMAIEEKDITFQSIAFGDVSPETYFTYQVGAEELWTQGYLGQDTYIAVLDVGINALHPMVSPAIVRGHSEVPFEPNWDSN
ncbi:hypothetical protein KAU55_03230, partial [Candidatus Bathyarchaeota archaeon]|nr:hypothetical protein [Candidatus Bathyarchaeota archaeon]